jgi:hypothetical protein
VLVVRKEKGDQSLIRRGVDIICRAFVLILAYFWPFFSPSELRFTSV